MQGVATRKAEFESARVRFLARSPDLVTDPSLSRDDQSDSALRPPSDNSANPAQHHRTLSQPQRSPGACGQTRRDAVAVFRAACRAGSVSQAGTTNPGGDAEEMGAAFTVESEKLEERLGVEEVLEALRKLGVEVEAEQASKMAAQVGFHEFKCNTCMTAEWRDKQKERHLERLGVGQREGRLRSARTALRVKKRGPRCGTRLGCAAVSNALITHPIHATERTQPSLLLPHPRYSPLLDPSE